MGNKTKKKERKLNKEMIWLDPLGFRIPQGGKLYPARLIDENAKDGRPELVWLLCNFH